MASKSYRKQKINLRLAGLSDELVTELAHRFAKATVKMNKRSIKDGLVALIKLDDAINYTKLNEFIRQHRLPARRCKIYVGLVTDQYMDGIRVPRSVVRLANNLGCELNFTFTRV